MSLLFFTRETPMYVTPCEQKHSTLKGSMGAIMAAYLITRVSSPPDTTLPSITVF